MGAAAGGAARPRFAAVSSGAVATLRARDADGQHALSPLEQARWIAELAQGKLAHDVVILDMTPVCTYTDYFVVCSGNNERQTKAIWNEVHERLKHDERLLPRSVEGERGATWIVGDYVDVVLHVFTPEARRFYRLEELWGDVPVVELPAEAAAG